YLRATRIAPNNETVWLQLGTAWLRQVEMDARILTSEWSTSAYVKLQAAESFADEDALGLAETAFRSAINSPSPPTCAHAEFGVVLLREGREGEARTQFEAEAKAAAPCGLARL